MKKQTIGMVVLVIFSLASGVFAQEEAMKVKGGHELGETAEQFFAEGHEKEMLSACAAGDFKGMNKPNKRQAKQYCGELAAKRQQMMSGGRGEYKDDGDPSEMRTDTFTFDGGHLVKVELQYSAPSAEFNYRGQTFANVLAGIKEAYGSPTSESTAPVQDVYGVKYLAHRELWLTQQAAILITEKPGPDGSTTLVALTRAEYDRSMSAGEPKPANPLQ
jgi:hypothetical protein